ncbi:MAG TPA: T9SS type A sorting domain-containing protein, partial [Chitinophagales bacterium]|nr:T9SS type A sorting domain-containing protein [Chitinophagales bacterium]
VINILNHDDEGQLLVDGVKVWDHDGFADVHYNVWSGCLSATSTLEFRCTEATGVSIGSIQLVNSWNISLNGPATICPGYSVQLTAPSADSYLWSTGETTQAISVNTAGTYAVTMLYGDCSATSQPVEIKVQPLPTPVSTVYGSNPYSSCTGVPDLGITNFSANYTYHWSNGMTGNVITPDGPGEFTVYATDHFGCQSAISDKVTLIVTYPPGNDTLFGDNQWNIYVYQDDVPDYYEYLKTSGSDDSYRGYLIDSALDFNLANHWEINSSPSSATGYQGCNVEADYFHFSAKRTGFDCGIYQINIPVHDDQAYLYVNGVQVWNESGTGNSANNVWSGLLKEDSKIEFQVYETGGDNLGRIEVLPVQLFTPVTPVISGPATICGTTPVTLDAGTGFSSYIWSTGSTSQTIAVDAAGAYGVTVTDTNGCVSTSQKSITTLSQNTYYADADGDNFGNNEVIIIDCTLPSGYVTNNTDCNDANGAVHPNAADICNSIDDNCDGVTDEHAISASVSPAGTAAFCSSGSVTLSANSGSGISYQWQKNSKNINGATGQVHIATAAGNYRVKETNSFGCASTSAATAVSKAATPSANITALGSLNICATGSVTLQANSGAGYSYQWFKGEGNLSGATQQTYTATKAATYKVMVTNSDGCSKISKGLKVTKSCRDGSSEGTAGLASLSVFPNPSNGNFMLTLNLNNETLLQATIQIFNSMGQRIHEQTASLNRGYLAEEIHVGNNLHAGIYIVRVIAGDQQFSSRMVIAY